MGRVGGGLPRKIFSPITYNIKKKGDHCVQTGEERKLIYCLGKVQKAVEEVPYAWHRPEDPNGYCLALPE